MIAGESEYENVIKIFNNVSSSEDLYNCLKEQAKRHECYRYYTTYSTYKKIIESKRIQASELIKFNDVDEHKYDNSEYTLFGICFSHEVYESLHLWYLYVGKERYENAVCYMFHSQDILRIIDEKNIIISEQGELDNGHKLNFGDFDICFSDIIYIKFKIGECWYDYCRLMNMGSYLEDFCNKHDGLWKNLLWKNEFETRILIKVKKNITMRFSNPTLYVGIPDKVNLGEDAIITGPQFDNHRFGDGVNHSEYEGRIRL